MGCAKSSHANENQGAVNRVRNPKPWTYDGAITSREIQEMRSTFWGATKLSSSGQPVIWEALQEVAACDDLYYKQKILDTHRIRLEAPYDMTVCYDDTNNRYELPKYVLSDPKNLDCRSIMDRIRNRN